MTASTGSDFPVDDATLILLNAACDVNPDSGQTHLHDFLSMGERIKGKTWIEDVAGIPIYEVELEAGYEPWSPHEAIRALIAEIQRLRFVVGSLGGGEA